MTEVNGREKPQTRRRKSLSDKQLAILEVIQRSIARHGYPPSMREIGDAVGLKSLSSVTHQLNQLELSGYLRRDAGKTRAMEVLIDLPGMSTENPADSAPSVGDAAMVPARRQNRRRRADHGRAAGRGDLPAPASARRQGRPVHAEDLGRVDDRRRDLRRRLGRRARAGGCRERRHRRGDARRRGDGQDVPSSRRPHVAAPPQLGVRADPRRRGRRFSARSWPFCAPSERSRAGTARCPAQSPDLGGMREAHLRHNEVIRTEEASCPP